MSRRLVVTAMVLAGGLFTIGCGSTPTSGPSSIPSGGRASSAFDEAKRKAEDAAKKTGEVVGAMGGEVKALQDEINKELEPVNKRIEELKKKVAEEKDAGVKADAQKMLSAGEMKLKEITEMVKASFTPEKIKGIVDGGKDALSKLRKELFDKIAEVKKAVGL